MIGRRGTLVLLLAGVVSEAWAQDSKAPAPAESPAPAATQVATPEPLPDCSARPLDAMEHDTLLRLAWRTLTGQLTEHPIKDADLEGYSFTPCLTTKRGLFVTLKNGGQVRGMQGEIDPSRPLYQQVIVFTRRAATRDPRFLPLTAADLGETTIEMAIIGARTRVSGPADLRLEGQGVFLEKWGRRALFLPAILSEQHWTAERVLDELCAQAALPRGSWSQSARIEMFATEMVSGSRPAEPPAAAPPTASPAPSASPEPAGAPGPILGQAPSAGARTTAGRSKT
jgi:AmmeMemoRadiSam system protein A